MGNVLQAQFGDPFHLGAGGGEFGGAVIGDAGLEGREDGVLGVVTHGDDEREAVLGHVGGVEALKAGAFVIRQRVERGAGLFGSGVRRKTFGRRKLARKVGMSAQDGEALVLRGGAEDAGERVVQARGAVMRGAEFEGPSAFGDPRGMFEDAAETRDETVPGHLRGAFDAAVGMGGGPMARDVDAAAEPDAVMGGGVVEKADQPGDLARASDQAAVQADGEHLGRARLTFGIKRVEAVFQIGKELFARDIARRRGKTHVIGFQRIGDDQLVMVATFAPIGQVVIIGV